MKIFLESKIMDKYDSKLETLLQIKRLNELLNKAAIELLDRAIVHDKSKLEQPEKDLYDRLTPLLKKVPSNSDKYKDLSKQYKIAIDHHYKNNRHHPEHYKNGVDDMTLFDVIEMAMDWLVDVGDSPNDIFKLLKENKEKYNLSEQLGSILENTYKKINNK